MNRFAKVSFIIMVATLAATTAFAANQATANIAVSANINPNCVITANPLAFGNYDQLGINSATDLQQTTTISVQCVDEETAAVSLDQGLYPTIGSTVTDPQRQM